MPNFTRATLASLPLVLSAPLWAAPVVVSEQSYQLNSDGRSLNVTLPGSRRVGNLLVCAHAVDGRSVTTTWPAGWREIADRSNAEVNISIGSRIIDGTESSSVKSTLSAPEKVAGRCWQIAGYDLAQSPKAVLATSDGLTAKADPPNLSLTGGAKDYLWLALSAADNATTTCTATPAGYGNIGSNGGDASAGHVRLCWGRKALYASSHDPSPYNLKNPVRNMGITLAVAPRSSTGRTDVFYTLDFESISPVTNPESWPGGDSTAHDGLILNHIGMYKQPLRDLTPEGSGGSATIDLNRTAAVRSLSHAQVIANGRNPSPLTGTNYLKGTIYIRPNDASGYPANYCGINGDGCGTSTGKDRPRINLRTRKVMDAAFAANSSHGAYRQTQYWCFDLGLPSTYHPVTEKRLTLMQIVSPSSTPENNIDLSIAAGPQGPAFRVERLYAEGDSLTGRPQDSSGRQIPIYSTPVTSGMVGKMVTHCFKANVDNRRGDGHPSFKWMMSVQGAMKLTTIAADTQAYGYSPTAGGKRAQPLDFYWTLPYGSRLNESGGTATSGYKSEAVSLILDNVRIGGPSSSIASVHPLAFPEPKCGPPYPCTD